MGNWYTPNSRVFLCYLVYYVVLAIAWTGLPEQAALLLAFLGLYIPFVASEFVLPRTESEKRFKDHPPWERETKPQHPREKLRAAIGSHPTREALRKYMDEHLWHRPPYCKRPDIEHCKDCPHHQDEGFWRRGNIVVKSSGVLDCRGRSILDRPKGTLCACCKHAYKHKKDEFYDCDEVWVATQDRHVPSGMNIYQPLFYEKKETCPYFEKDPSREEEFQAGIKEWTRWQDFLDGKTNDLEI